MKAKRKVTAEQMQPELERSIRDIVIDQLHATNLDNFQHGEPVERLSDKAILNELIESVYAHIEAKALEVYKCNEPWALKAWAYSNILKDVVSNEANQGMVEELMSPIVEWQHKSFDPIDYYKKRIERKSEKTQQAYLETACRFVAKEGRKMNYTDQEVEDYQLFASKRYTNECSYHLECQRLRRFLRRLPGADRARELPLDMPKMPKKFYQPTATQEQIETIAWATVIDQIDCNMIVRLACASIYGRRRKELAELSAADIHLDGANSWINFKTKKGGEESPHPIPQSLLPLFAVPVTKMGEFTIQRQLQKICKRAGIRLPKRAGYHWLRRNVATTIKKAAKYTIGIDAIDASRYMRWSTQRELTMLDRYDQTPFEEGDRAILNVHPTVGMWQEVLPYLLELNPCYQESSLLFDIIK